jgi:dUTP pyrophosphatase
MITVRFKKLSPDAVIPTVAHGGYADNSGADLVAIESVNLIPGDVCAVSTGLAIELPIGFEAQIRPRSGMGKQGIIIPNAPGTIDPSYRGEIKVLLLNTSTTPYRPYRIEVGDRIAQIVVARYEPVEWLEADELSTTRRGVGGFGSTGMKS